VPRPAQSDADYRRKLRREITFYRDVSDVHDLPPAHDYVAGRYLTPRLLEAFGYADYPSMILDYLRAHPTPAADVEVLSLGSGNCDFEIGLVATHGLCCRMTCTEINPDMLERARHMAQERGVEDRFTFVCVDVNELSLDRRYDLILANHSLHHFVKLEAIFNEVAGAMGPDSLFLINDMIGRNHHLFWPPTLDLVNRLWDTLPADLKVNRQTGKLDRHRLQIDPSGYGFEGVRAQDILPLLDERFDFQDFAPFFTLVNRFIDRDFGHDFDLDDPLHTAFLDYAMELDDYCLREHLLRPTQMLAALRPRSAVVTPRLLGGLTPAAVLATSDDALYARFERDVATRTERSRWSRLPRHAWRRLRRL
jgi:hypothetical protein